MTGLLLFMLGLLLGGYAVYYAHTNHMPFFESDLEVESVPGKAVGDHKVWLEKFIPEHDGVITIEAPETCTECGIKPESGYLHFMGADRFLCNKCYFCLGRESGE